MLVRSVEVFGWARERGRTVGYDVESNDPRCGELLFDWGQPITAAKNASFAMKALGEAPR